MHQTYFFATLGFLAGYGLGFFNCVLCVCVRVWCSSTKEFWCLWVLYPFLLRRIFYVYVCVIMLELRQINGVCVCVRACIYIYIYHICGVCLCISDTV